MDHTFEYRKPAEWLGCGINQETFARAWLDGYEVEKEKRYKVIIRNVKKSRSCLTYNIGEGKWYFKSWNTKGGAFRVNHTRKELEEANFGWVFDCPGIEIEEVNL
ncbi:Phage protein [Streptococcus sp. DD10]|nr:Phage protein [Streptococcus sp. DD10]